MTSPVPAISQIATVAETASLPRFTTTVTVVLSPLRW
jgi:hypothetical protein